MNQRKILKAYVGQDEMATRFFGGNADWNATEADGGGYILNKPDLATVATTGSYNDLLNKPTIPTVVTRSGNNNNFIIQYSDGRLEQGGVATIPATGGVTVVFQIPFYVLYYVNVVNLGLFVDAPCVTEETNDHIVLDYYNSQLTANVRWYAIGWTQ
jgi:hypothetical protein